MYGVKKVSILCSASLIVVIPAPIFIGINSSRNPGFPKKVGNHLKHWAPVFTGETTFYETIKI